MGRKFKKKRNKFRYRGNRGIKGMVKPQYVMSENPFYGLEIETIEEMYIKYGKGQKDLFEQKLNEVREIIEEYDPVDLVSSFTMYFLTLPIGEDPEMKSVRPILQFHVELLQALSLQSNIKDNKKSILLLDVQKLENVLKELSNAFTYKRLMQIEKIKDEKDSYWYWMIESIRVSTLAIRNWGYPKQVIDITCELFNNINEETKSFLGIDLIRVLMMYEHLVRQIENNLHEYLKKISELRKCNNNIELINLFLNEFPIFEEHRNSFMNLGQKIANKEELFNILSTNTQSLFYKIYSFASEDCKRLYGDEIGKEKIEGIIKNTSYSYGDLKDFPAEHIFLDNPIWEKPFIKTGDSRYSWPIPGLLYNTSIELIENVFIHNENIKDKYEKGRSTYLENKLENLFLKAFPEANIFKNNYWYDEIEGKEYENDLLILIDTTLIVVEAKSGRISKAAKRGAPESLKRDIKDLLVNPSIQARRFSKYLREIKHEVKLKNSKKESFKINISDVKRIIRVCVNLELLGFITSRLTELFESGLVDDKEFLCPTMTIAELETVFDLLETSCEKIHYLHRRDEIQKNLYYHGDELDLVVFYLETGFNIGEIEFNNQPISIQLASKTLDEYYVRKYYEQMDKIIKPRPRRTKWWQKLIIQLEKRKFLAWTEVAYTLLNVTFEDQLKFQDMINEVKRTVKKEWNKPGHKDCVLLINAPQYRKELIMGYSYKNISREERDKNIRVHAGRFMEENELDKILVIGFDVNDTENIYSIIGFLFTTENKK